MSLQSCIPGLIHTKNLEKIDKSQPINHIFLAINGSLNNINSYDITVNEILPYIKNRELICCHVYNTFEDQEFNWRFQKNIVVDKYLFYLQRKCIYPNKFYTQDKRYYHNVQQLNKVATDTNSLYFIIDFNAIKEQNLNPKNLKTGLDFLFSISNKIPTLLIKEETLRKDKENKKGYTWLFILDKENIDCIKVLEFFMPLINKKKDTVYAYILIPSYYRSDKVSPNYIKLMEKNGMKKNRNFFYTVEFYSENYFKTIKEYVNNNDDIYFDNVLFYNNPAKYNKNDSYRLAVELSANIGFVNVADIPDFEPEKLYDRMEIERIEYEQEMRRLRQLLINQQNERDEHVIAYEFEARRMEREGTNVSMSANKKILPNYREAKVNDDEPLMIFSKNLLELPKLPVKNRNMKNEINKNNNNDINKSNDNFYKTKTKSFYKLNLRNSSNSDYKKANYTSQKFYIQKNKSNVKNSSSTRFDTNGGQTNSPETKYNLSINNNKMIKIRNVFSDKLTNKKTNFRLKLKLK